MTDYLALVHRFVADGVIGEMDCVYSSWATDAPGGFGEDGIAALQRLAPFLKLAVKSASLARIAGTLVETYLGARGIGMKPPATIRYLPALKPEWHPAMMAAFGVATEPEPGRIEIADVNVRGIHLTLLKPDGSGKAGTDRDKIMIGRSAGWPIVLAPPNDGLGLCIAEGNECALSICEGVQVGCWAAGSASRMPALADKVPFYIDAVTIAAHSDPGGMKGATELAVRLNESGIFAEVVVPPEKREAA
jgi:hypothetical protein